VDRHDGNSIASYRLLRDIVGKFEPTRRERGYSKIVVYSDKQVARILEDHTYIRVDIVRLDSIWLFLKAHPEGATSVLRLGLPANYKELETYIGSLRTLESSGGAYRVIKQVARDEPDN
jgi:hypothetical protein